jgi:hypothetical protein
MSISTIKNDKYYAITNTAAVVPASTTKTGTITTDGVYVNGTGTLFRSELKPGDWIVDVSQTECRKVLTIGTDLNLSIDSAFTNPIVAGALNVVRSRARMISVSNDGGADADVDGVVMKDGAAVTFTTTSKNTYDTNYFIDPLIVDATGTVVKVGILK